MVLTIIVVFHGEYRHNYLKHSYLCIGIGHRCNRYIAYYSCKLLSAGTQVYSGFLLYNNIVYCTLYIYYNIVSFISIDDVKLCLQKSHSSSCRGRR